MRFLREWKRWRVGGIVAALTASLVAALLTVEDARPADEAPKEKALPTDLAKIPSDALFAVSLRIAEVWSGDLPKALREKHTKEIGFILEQFQKYTCLPLEQMERMTMVLLDPPPGGGEPLFFARTLEPFDLAKILAANKGRKKHDYKSQTFYAASEKDWAFYPLDKRSFVLARFNDVRVLIDHPQPEREGRLAPTLRLAAGRHAMALGFNLKTFMDAVGDKLPGEVDPFRPLLQAQWGTATVDLGKNVTVETALHFDAEKEAKEAIQPGQTGLSLLRVGLKSAIVALKKENNIRHVLHLLERFEQPLNATRIERRDNELRAAAVAEVDPIRVGSALVDTVNLAFASNRRNEDALHLRQIAIAAMNHNDVYGRLPAQAVYDKNGKALLSWRVMLLPHLNQSELYKQFHLNEPWDSEHNKKLLAKLPDIYRAPRQDAKSIEEHRTYYQGFVGKGCFFEGKKGLRFPAEFPDGTSNTIMIVEASSAVPWTKPEDIPYDADKPLPKLGLPGSSEFHTLQCDGSVRTHTAKISEKTLRLAITRNDGMPLGDDF